ncbi:MAG: M1 family metallopeptidase [Bacteroidota bacterium]
MRLLTLGGIFCLLLTACNTSKNTLTFPGIEERIMDTLVVTASPITPDEDEALLEEIAAEDYELPNFNPSATQTFDLLHTKLEVRFNWEKEQVIGKAHLVLKPYFYATDELVLDAKNFEFNSIKEVGGKIDLKYTYDEQQVTIDLGRELTREDTIEIAIDYVATPAASGGSAAITSDKGLFFINPSGEEDKPQQIWTQGETEHNSRWFPTIDKPNERTTQEIYLTVEDRFRTLSNGLLMASEKHEDGTRTDYWKMDQPHAPYLFMVAIGEFAVVQERWNEMLLEYYVEPEYREVAKQIFPYTPEMLTFFSDILDFKYPWQKYSQVVVRDYVSGAMENTTAVIFGEFMQGDAEFLKDNLTNEKIVAHEMFHHWFGDYVTCESWANLTMNEGFANYSEYLWLEEKHGRDEADYHWLQELRGYLAQSNIHPLIYYGYNDKEDMFDQHSYNKGGLVLHMLRNYVGDEAFYAALNLYLTRHAYTAVEVDELRLAFEDVTGKDLIWFFDQWYHNQGHPQLNINYEYDEIGKKAIVMVEQTQDVSEMPGVFQMPVTVDIYVGDEKPMRQEIFINERVQNFEFDVSAKPNLINFNADRTLLAEIEDNKTEAEYAFQYEHAPLFMDRYEALQSVANSESAVAASMFKAALKDDFYGLRDFALYQVDMEDESMVKGVQKMAESDPKADVRSAALDRLMELANPKYASFFEKVIKNDEAGSVKSTARLGLGSIYVASGDLKNLTFFEENWSAFDYYDAINFFDLYSELAKTGGAEEIVAVATKLKEVSMTDTSLWKRFGATKAINTLHATLVEKADSEGSDGQQFTDADGQLLAMIKEIKDAETDPQLQQIYSQIPQP